eukprot:4263622-Ditylum_brightwellii.AAC.1
MHAAEVESLKAELQSLKLTHSEEASVLHSKVEKLQEELQAKDGINALLQSDVGSLQEERKIAAAKYDEGRSEMQNLLASQKDELNK